MASKITTETQGAPAKSAGGIPFVVELLIMAVTVVVLVWGLKTFVYQAYEIPTGSMEPTIQCNTKIFEGTFLETTANDMVFSEKITYYGRGPEAGDIVTFDDPLQEGRVLIKRVVATGGQTVTLKDGLVYVDGQPLDEPYTGGKPSNELRSQLVSYPYTVPEGHIWVMGDNRTNSQDSRYFGAVPVSSVTGRAVLVYWPLNHFGFLK